MQAVILAAGMGMRIRDHHVLPKGLIKLGGDSIIQESIDKLNSVGVTDTAIVTGYLAKDYAVFAEKNNLQIIFNPEYNRFGSLYSLYCAKEFVSEDCLILESDIIYEKRALEKIIQDSHPNTILLSGTTYSGDEVYVETDDQHHLIRMSKQKNKLTENKIEGEFVGINKLSLDDYRKLLLALERDEKKLQTGCYDEQGFEMITHFNPVFCLKIADLLWCEIDNGVQLEMARKLYEFV